MPDPVHLSAEDLLVIAAAATGAPAVVRDYGLLDAAANRPRASAFGQDAYPNLHHKAAALLQSLVMNHGLVDGNKRLAWLATVVFYDLNDHDLTVPTDEGFDLMMAVINGHLDVDTIAASFEPYTRRR
jgi:death on curing protein